MKPLKQYIEDLVLATPLNSIGMGDAYATSDGLFSEPLCSQPCPSKRLKSKPKRISSNHLKDFIWGKSSIIAFAPTS